MSTNPIAESPLTASFDAFYREDRQRLIQFLVSLGAPRADAEDIVQEAMAVTFNAWSRASINPRPYVRTVARRMYWHHVEENNRRNEAFQRAAVSDAGELDAYDSDARHLIEMLRRLPTAQREVMAWDIEGFAADEIAEHTGSPASTVRSNLRHARAAMVRMLRADQQREEEEDDPQR